MCLAIRRIQCNIGRHFRLPAVAIRQQFSLVVEHLLPALRGEFEVRPLDDRIHGAGLLAQPAINAFRHRSEEHTSELQSLMRISYAVFCLKKTKIRHKLNTYKL